MGRPWKSYGEPCDSMLAELRADVTAGRLVAYSKEWRRRYSAARRASPLVGPRWYAQNREANRRYRERNIGKLKAMNHGYYVKNREARLAWQRRYDAAHREEKKAYDAARFRSGSPQTRPEREARRLVATNGLTFTQAVLHALGGACGIETLPPLSH